jgi:hypothetical protein
VPAPIQLRSRLCCAFDTQAAQIAEAAGYTDTVNYTGGAHEFFAAQGRDL